MAEERAGEPVVRTLRVDHVGVAVRDADAVVGMLTGLFGLEVEHRETNEEQGVAEVVLRATGTDSSATVVQLVSPLRDDSPVGRFLDRRGPGLHHLALTVADIDTAVSQLHRRGVRVVTDGPRPGTSGSRITFIHPQDAGGVLVELVEPGRPAGPDTDTDSDSDTDKEAKAVRPGDSASRRGD